MSRSLLDRILIWLLRLCAFCAASILILVIVFVVNESLPALSGIGLQRFFSDAGWHPSESLYHITPMIVGTLWATIGAILMALPIGIISAIFCRFYAPAPVANIYRQLIELLAGIPSVVYGFWGLIVIVPLIANLHPPGASLLAGIVILTLMILPTIALIADASFAAVPQHYVSSATALGLSRWTLVCHIMIPASRAGLAAGIMLAAGRALGETMAILMVSGNVVNNPTNIFEPIRTLTANIAIEMAYAMGDHRASLFFSGLVLMALVIALVITASRFRQTPNHA